MPNRSLAVLVALALAACSSSPVAGGDGGPVDSGPAFDAGGKDGGPRDAGNDFDAGSDAGYDGGFDAGYDAGFDAGACPQTCTWPTPVCDGASGTCKRCTATAGCNGTTPVCDTSADGGLGACGCTDSSQCPSYDPVCDPTQNRCVACVANTDCKGAKGVCDPSTNTCVECLTDTDCPTDGPNYCLSNTCLCTDSRGCGGATPVCQLQSSIGYACVQCLQDSDCSGSTPYCDPFDDRCKVCSQTQGCSGSTPGCELPPDGGIGACVACTRDTDCPTSGLTCDTAQNACVTCTATNGCAAPACAPGQWCYTMPLPFPWTLNAVFTVSSTDVWAGTYQQLLHYDGTSWSATPAGIDVDAIWGSSANDIWAVGDGILHWNGSAWASVTDPTIERIQAISGTAANDIWAAVQDGSVLHYDGSAWTVATTLYDGLAIYAAGPNDVWMGGTYDWIWHYDGGSWDPAALNTGDGYPDVIGISGSGPSDVWLVTNGPDLYTGNGPYLFHWDGAHLNFAARPPGATSYSAIYAAAANDLWVFAGFDAYHFDGTSWSRQPTGLGAQIRGAHGAASNDIWAVGDNGGITHWDGTRWQPLTSAAPARGALTSVRGSSVDDAWAVGGNGTILHWDGSAWSFVPSSTTKDLRKVWVTSPSDVWAAGADGLFHWDGGAWGRAGAGDRDVWASGPDDVWAVDSNGYAWHFDGGSWTSNYVENGFTTSFPLISVWGSGPGDVYTIDDYIEGSYFHYSSGFWRYDDFQPYPNYIYITPNVYSGSGPNDVWLSGDKLFHYDGTSWRDVGGGVGKDIWIDAPGDMWVPGAHYHYQLDGGGFTNLAPTGGLSASVWAGDGGALTVGGNAAMIYRP